MRDISLHILDIAENSVKAGAKNIDILIYENEKKDSLKIKITDDGIGMEQKWAEKAADPFVTTRTARKIGMGLPLLKASAEQAGGTFKIKSFPGKGTKVEAAFKLSHIDRKPIGNMAHTILALVTFSSEINIRYVHRHNKKGFVFDSRDFSGNGSSINKVLEIKKYLQENTIIK